MSKEEKKKTEEVNTTSTAEDAKAAEDAKDGESVGEDKLGEMEQRIANLEHEYEQLEKEKEELEMQKNEYYDQLKRIQADFENYKKRIAREWDVKSAEKAKELVGDILPIIDNFERALENADEEEVDPNFYEGVKMIYDQLYDVLTNKGLERIEALGKEFDPNYHEAVMQVESEEYESNVVVEELQPGFMFNGRLLRASVVKVAR